MLEIKEMLPQDEAAVLPMVNGFYHSDAVDHQVDEKILRKTFLDAVSRRLPGLKRRYPLGRRKNGGIRLSDNLLRL